MQKTIEQEVPASTRKITIYVCDICGKEHRDTSYGKMKQCGVCGRLTCGYYTIVKHEPCGHNDPDDSGDYPSWYCIHCYDLRYKKYGAEWDKLEKDYYEAREAIEKKVKEESLVIGSVAERSLDMGKTAGPIPA